MAWNQTYAATSRKKRWWVVFLAGLLAIVASVLIWLFITTRYDTTNSSTQDLPLATDTTPTDDQQPVLPPFDVAALQEDVNEWSSQQRGDASVIIADPNGEVLATSGDSEKVYFAASLYKLYTAYFGYQQLDRGEVDASQTFQGGRTRLECLDAMIRSSDSACAEKLWVELGKENQSQLLKNISIENTDMTAITTTATDVSRMLKYIARGDGLSSDSQKRYMSSMESQDALYRRGLPSGFSSAVTVFNKVGWNEYTEWHDAAIVQLPDGRELIIVVMTENVGYQKIAQLATTIESTLDQ